MNVKYWASLTVLAAAVWSNVAEATTPTITPSGGHRPTPITVARAAWPGSPCYGREIVTFTDAISPDRGGQAFNDGSCRVEVRPVFLEHMDQLCRILAHEFGHLAGHGHEPNGVMDPNNHVYPPCDRFAPPDPLRSPRAMAADGAGVPERTCRLVELDDPWRRYRCKGGWNVRVWVAREIVRAERLTPTR